MDEKYKNINLIDELDATFTDVKNQLIEDEKHWSDTWKERGLIYNGNDQETRWFQKMKEYFDQYREWGEPIPWTKIIGEAHIALVREKANKTR